MDVMELRRRILSESGGVPPIYEPVEYLQSDGNQWFDSGVVCTYDLGVDYSAQCLNEVNRAWCGGIDLRNAPIYFRHHSSPNSGTIYWIQNDNRDYASIGDDNIHPTDRITAHIDPVSGTAFVNGNNYTFTPLTSGTTGRGYGIFARISNVGDIQSRPSKIYYFKLFKGTKLLRNFVPVVRRIDNKPGMYDTVTKSFFVNQGTGEFFTPLPQMYLHVEYIENPSTALIIADYEPVRYDEVSARFSVTGQSDYGALFYCGTESYQFGTLLEPSRSGFWCKYFASGGAPYLDFDEPLSTNTWYDFSVSSIGVFSCDGKNATSTYQAQIDGTDKRLWVLRRANGNSPFVGKLASFVVKNNGINKLNLVPCVRLSDDKAGMYDTVSQTFYTSASAYSQFVAGPIVY